MQQFIERNRKRIFILILVGTYLCMFAYIFLTPYLSDDFPYMMELRDMGTGSITDAFRLAYAEYFQHGGRLLHYSTFRLFLLAPTKHIYDFFASGYFVLLGLLIYLNIDKRKKYDIGVILLSYLGLWLFSIRPGQTITWITGGVVYLFAFVYVLGSITYYRYLLRQDSLKRPALSAVLMFVISLLAGDASENNAPAVMLVALIVTISKFVSIKKNDSSINVRKFIKPYMITAVCGYIIGYAVLVLSPGTWERASVAAEGEYTGIVGLLSHLYKIAMALNDLFLPFFIVIGILITLLAVNRYFTCFKDIVDNSGILYLVAALAGSLVLVVISTPEYRAFFGTAVFIMISIIQLLQDLSVSDPKYDLKKAVKYSIVVSLCIVFTFVYLENLVNLARIYREKNEQFSILEDAVANGNTSYVEIPQLHEPFDNKYTIAYYPQLDEDPSFWLNVFYEEWFGIDQISAIPRDIWDENH